MQHIFFSSCFCQFKSRFCIYSWGGVQTMIIFFFVPLYSLCSSFSLNWQIIWNAFVLCLFGFFWFYVCLLLVFLCVLFFVFSILAHFLASGCMFVKASSKTQEKSFNYIYNGIKIKILICLVISVFFPSICFVFTYWKTSKLSAISYKLLHSFFCNGNISAPWVKFAKDILDNCGYQMYGHFRI